MLKGQFTKEQVNKLHFIKNFCFSKDTARTTKRQAITERKDLQSMYDKGHPEYMRTHQAQP